MIDLHLHLDGSLPYSTLRKLSELSGVKLPENNVELKKLVAVPENCTDLTEYLKCFELPVSLLQTCDAVYCAVLDLCLYLKQSGMIYSEIRFAPQKHTSMGCSQKDIVEAAIKGINKSGFNANLILCCIREKDNELLNLETVKVASEFLYNGVVALDLAGDEHNNKTENYKYIFDVAQNASVPYTIHAGEADGKKSINYALDFGASRIGHGINAIYDNKTINRLVDLKVPLEICVTSNVQTKATVNYKMHPIKKLMDKGVVVTVNSDNMIVSDTDIYKEFRIVRNLFGIDTRDLLLNSINSAFCDDDTKKFLLKKI